MARMDPEAEKKQAAKEKSAAVLRRLDASGIRDKDEDVVDGAPRTKREDLVLTQYEQSIAMEVVHPDEIDVSFNGELTKQYVVNPSKLTSCSPRYRRLE
jgi:hypothetical protein